MRRLAAWGLLIGLLLIGLRLAACGGEAEPPRFPVPGTIVYTSGVDLWLQEGEETPRLLLSAAPEQQLLQPELSPDGAQVAYIVFQLTDNDDTPIGSSVAVSPLRNPSQRLVFAHTARAEFAWQPRWTADGASLLFTHEPAAPSGGGVRVLQLELDSGSVALLRDDAREADLSPDGRHLIFLNAPLSGDPHLVLQDLQTGEERDLDPDRAWQPRPYRLPQFTPDGRYIIFSAGQYLPQVTGASSAAGLNGPEDIWRVEVASGELAQLAALGEDQPDFALSADGRHVLILGAYGVYLVQTTPGGPAFALAPGEFHGSIAWRGTVSDAQWADIQNAAFAPAADPQ